MTAKISCSFKRAWIRRVYNRSVASSTTLLAELTSELNTRTDAVLTGSAISSSAADGHSVSFSEPGKGSPGPALIAELCDEMLVRYDQAKTDLGGSPTDAQIFAKMLTSLYPARESTNSFSNLRLA